MIDINARGMANNSSKASKDIATNVKQLGAKGDNINDDSSSIQQLTTSDNGLLPKGTYKTTNQINFNTNSSKIEGNKGAIINATNANTSQDLYINASNVEISSIELDSASTTQALGVGSNLDNIKILNSKIVAQGHGFQMNNAGNTNIQVTDSYIKAQGYGILVNYNCTSGENMTIMNNRIYSANADAIELNIPHDANTDQVFRGFRIIGNHIQADTIGTSTSAGFAIGIANAKDITMVGNTISKSRNDALHIEDSQENITITGNVFNNCYANGLVLYNAVNAKPVIVTSNQFKKCQDNWKQGNGLSRTNTPNGVLQNCILRNNIFRGFNTGIYLGGGGISDIDGCVVSDCNTAISLDGGGTAKGSIIAHNCSTLASGATNTRIGKIVSSTTPTTILNCNAANGTQGCTLEGFKFPSAPCTTINGNNTFDLFPLPKLMKGRLVIQLSYNSVERVFYYTADVLWDGTTITLSNKLSYCTGAISSIDVSNNSGQLAVLFWTNAVRTFTFDVDFTGEYYKAN